MSYATQLEKDRVLKNFPLELQSVGSSRISTSRDLSQPAPSLTKLGYCVALMDFAVISLLAALIHVLYINGYLLHETSVVNYAAIGGLTAFLTVLCLNQTGIYKPAHLITKRIPLARLLGGLVLGFAILVSLLFLVKVSEQYSRGWIVIWFVTSYVVLVLTRLVLVLYVRLLAAEGRLKKKVVVYGQGVLGAKVVDYLETMKDEISIVGSYADEWDNQLPDAIGGGTRLQGLGELIEFCQTNSSDCVVVAVPPSQPAHLRQVVHELSVLPAEVLICPEVFDLPVKVRAGRDMGDLLLMEVQSQPLSESARLIKSAMDYVLASVAMVLLLPVFAVIALAIKLDSRGSVFFVQRRTGYNQQVIGVIKFRSMTVTEDGDDVRQAQKNDKRITRVGWFLRRSSLDELPQLINVLRGEMSLVGPRPHALSHNDQFRTLINQYSRRHSVKPGITGWAQVNGLRGETKNPDVMRARVEHDLHYIRNCSIALDLEILVRTVGAVLWAENAH